MRCAICDKLLTGSDWESLGDSKGNYGICSSHPESKNLNRLALQLAKLYNKMDKVKEKLDAERHRIGTQFHFHDFN